MGIVENCGWGYAKLFFLSWFSLEVNNFVAKYEVELDLCFVVKRKCLPPV